MCEDIVKLLLNKKHLVDSAIMRYLPRRFDKDYLEFAFGKPKYAYDLDALSKSLAEPVWDFLDRGGKRWRPALFMLITEALGGDIKKIQDFVILPELIHNGSIIIDDIQDMGELRRGKPTIHRIFGTDIAINAGNFLYFLPLLVFMKNRHRFKPETLLRAYEIYSQEMINIHAGQAMDIWWHKGKTEDIDERQYMQMCAYKTGTLARMAARLAVALCEGSKEMEEKIGRVAESIGVAFQIQDDILDIVSSGKDREKFGKSYGNDITEGKRTLMVIYTLKKASKEDRGKLLKILNMHTKDRGLIDEAIEILKKYGSVEYAKSVASKIMKESWEEAEPLFEDSEAKNKLRRFVHFLIDRDF